VSKFACSSTPPAHWDALCDASGALFSTAAWQRVLEKGFGCRTLYVANPGFGLAIPIFRAGPFRVGYAGFPAGRWIGPREQLAQALFDLKTSDASARPVCLRISPSPFANAPEFELPFVANPETAIENLQDWGSSTVSKKLRRDLRRAEKFPFDIGTSTDVSLAASVYGMYRETVSRHQGSLRYTEAYFEALLELAESDDRVRLFAAHRDDHLAGFAITVDDGATTHYLHGGTHADYRRESPSDLLLVAAINRARQDGANCFNLMASPANQPGLVRYKEKWGATTKELRTYTVPLRVTYPAFRAAEWLYRIIR